MIVRKVTREQMESALEIVNRKYADNLCWHHIDTKGSGFSFRLYTKDSHKPGARLHISCYSIDGKDRRERRGRSACWHAHGDFFDALFTIEHSARIHARKKLITKLYGNWEDSNIGSMLSPLMYSESCRCSAKGRVVETPMGTGVSRTIQQGNLSSECWNVQVWGIERCRTCELKDNEECGGKNIIKTGKNDKGIGVPIV